MGAGDFCMYVRQDGTAGIRNLLLVVSVIDLANDVAMRIATALDDSVAVLSPGGGLSFGKEAALLERLRRRLVCNPNVGGAIFVGPNAALLGAAESDIRATGRLSAAISLSEAKDSIDAVQAGLQAGRSILAALQAAPRVALSFAALRIGLRSSNSSLESAKLVNPVVGMLADEAVRQGGTVCFSELADLAGVAPSLAVRGENNEASTALLEAMAEPCRLVSDLAGDAPDPTLTNLQGGIDTIEKKGEGALRRLGSSRIRGVFAFGDAIPAPGLWMMAGPGSAAVGLTGLAAAGCSLIVYTVGVTGITAGAPIMPVIKIGPSGLAGSRDVDLHLDDPAGEVMGSLMTLVGEVASGRRTAGEALQTRQIMLPGHLPQL